MPSRAREKTTRLSRVISGQIDEGFPIADCGRPSLSTAWCCHLAAFSHRIRLLKCGPQTSDPSVANLPPQLTIFAEGNDRVEIDLLAAIMHPYGGMSLPDRFRRFPQIQVVTSGRICRPTSLSPLSHRPRRPIRFGSPVTLLDHLLRVFGMASRFTIDYLIGNEEEVREQSNPQPIARVGKRFHPGLRGVRLRLEGLNLWRRFHELGTEMIVTKSGRRMFPTLQFNASGMSPTLRYSIMVDFNCIDQKRYRYSFHQSKWVVAGPGDVELPCRMHMHVDSPSSGAHWMKQVIAFERIKLTNHQLDQNGYIIVNSMHRYQPRIHVIVHNDNVLPDSDVKTQRTFTFSETQFMAVTAYQNHRITELKIESNPFAKGFRECELDEINLLASTAQLQLHYAQLYPLVFNNASLT